MTKFISHINAALEARGMAREEGQGVVEYSLVLGVIVVALFVAFQFAGLGAAVTGAVQALVAVF